MALQRFGDWFLGLFGRGPRHEEDPVRKRGPALHVIILDGTMSSLSEGYETNAGQTYKLLREAGRTANLTLHYEAGIQWRDWRETYTVMTGKGINRQIRRAYGVLASRYRPGDRIMLIGYSRGAYAVRSLSGVIGSVGLLRAHEATVRNIRQAYRLYQSQAGQDLIAAFRAANCHPETAIEAIGVWDTVKALGLRLPLLWRLTEEKHKFHDHRLGPHVAYGYHALGIDETREGYWPVLWTTPDNFDGRVEQVWFRGTHGDVGGQIGDFFPARPLANIPLVWLLERLADCGLPLPEDWQSRFEQDPSAPVVSTWRGWGKLFLLRKRREIGFDKSEFIHPTAEGHPLGAELPVWSPLRHPARETAPPSV